MQTSIQAHECHVRSCEQELKRKLEALDFAKSDAGRQQAKRKWNNLGLGRALSGGTHNRNHYSNTPEEEWEDEKLRANRDLAQAREALGKARTELEAQSSALEHLHAQDAEWEQIMPTSQSRLPVNGSAIADTAAVNQRTSYTAGKPKAKSGPGKAKRGKAIRGILGKNPTLTARQVCDRIDELYGAKPLANPQIVPFRSKGEIFPRWSEAYQQNKKSRAAIDQLIARNRPK